MNHEKMNHLLNYLKELRQLKETGYPCETEIIRCIGAIDRQLISIVEER